MNVCSRLLIIKAPLLLKSSPQVKIIYFWHVQICLELLIKPVVIKLGMWEEEHA